MLYGHIESVRHRLEHLDALRRQQDESGGFACFIPLSFQVKNNLLGVREAVTGVYEIVNLTAEAEIVHGFLGR